MTRKDFIAIAARIKGMDVDDATRAKVARGLGEVFETLNPRFDWTRFLDACGVVSTTRPAISLEKGDGLFTGASSLITVEKVRIIGHNVNVASKDGRQAQVPVDAWVKVLVA